MASFDQGVHAAARRFCADHKTTRFAFQCLYCVHVGHCAHKLHRLAAAWASHIVAVLTHSIFPDTQSHGPRRDRASPPRYCMQNLAD
jgi:hypothetical protein